MPIIIIIIIITDGKRPDGLTLIPWREVRCLMWNTAVADTTAASYLPSTAMSSGSTAELAAASRDKVCGVVALLRVHARSLQNARIFLQEDYEFRFRTWAAYIGHYSVEDENVFPLSETLYHSSSI